MSISYGCIELLVNKSVFFFLSIHVNMQVFYTYCRTAYIAFYSQVSAMYSLLQITRRRQSRDFGFRHVHRWFPNVRKRAGRRVRKIYSRGSANDGFVGDFFSFFQSPARGFYRNIVQVYSILCSLQPKIGRRVRTREFSRTHTRMTIRIRTPTIIMIISNIYC